MEDDKKNGGFFPGPGGASAPNYGAGGAKPGATKNLRARETSPQD